MGLPEWEAPVNRAALKHYKHSPVPRGMDSWLCIRSVKT